MLNGFNQKINEVLNKLCKQKEQKGEQKKKTNNASKSIFEKLKL